MATSSQPASPGIIIFGSFEYHIATGTLRKYGTRIRLQGQPLQILSQMLSRPGVVISRDELQKLLWSGTTFVDFEQGLNAAVNKLRQALGDSADQPRYIATEPGLGYRFIAPIQTVAAKPILEMLSQGTGQLSPDRPGNRQPTVFAPLPHPLDPPPNSHRARRIMIVSGSALLVAGMALVAWRGSRPMVSSSETVRFRIPVPNGVKLSGSQTFSLSPDGNTLVYLAQTNDGVLRLWAQSLRDLEPRMLPGTESSADPPAFWSPDSRFVVFCSNEKLKKVDLIGSPPQIIASVSSVVLGGTWNREGMIVFGTETLGIMRTSAEGGQVTPLTRIDTARGERVHAFPTFLPDGRHFLYSRLSSLAGNSGVFVRSIDLKPEDPDLRLLVRTPHSAQFVPGANGNGILLFQREDTLWAQALDTSRLELIGEPKKVVDQVGSTRASGYFASSMNGRLIYRSALSEIGQLSWFDRLGRRTATVGESFFLDAAPVLAPQGDRFVMSKYDLDNPDIWIYDLARDVSQRMTVDPGLDVSPIWSRDGKWIVFSSGRAGHYDLYRIGTTGGSHEELLYASPDNKFASSMTPDGQFLLYSTRVDGANPDIWLLPLEADGKRIPMPVVQTSASETAGIISPDGRWLAYVSDESGKPEIYLQPFSPSTNSSARTKVLLSREGGNMPRWRSDARELFYRALDGTLMSIAVGAGASLQPGSPQPLFRLASYRWDVASDGNSFLVSVPVEQTVPPFTVVLNWTAEWKK